MNFQVQAQSSTPTETIIQVNFPLFSNADKIFALGTFRNNLPTKNGIMVCKNKKTYEGIFQLQLICFYLGQWKHGKYHGKGTLKYPNSDEFEGEFVDNLKHGKGIMKFATGDTKEGYWEQDQYIGETKRRAKSKLHTVKVSYFVK